MRAPCVPSASEGLDASSRAGLFDYDRDHGERTGQGLHRRARPASIAPARTKTKELETQAEETQTDVTLKCYGELLTVPAGEEFICASP